MLSERRNRLGFFDFFLRNKRREWANYRSHVTPFELKTYLGL